MLDPPLVIQAAKFEVTSKLRVFMGKQDVA